MTGVAADHFGPSGTMNSAVTPIPIAGHRRAQDYREGVLVDEFRQ